MKLQFDLWLRLARTDRVALTKLILLSGLSCEFLATFDKSTLDGIIERFVASSDWPVIEQAIRVALSADVREQARKISAATLLITAKFDDRARCLLGGVNLSDSPGEEIRNPFGPPVFSGEAI